MVARKHMKKNSQVAQLANSSSEPTLKSATKTEVYFKMLTV